MLKKLLSVIFAGVFLLSLIGPMGMQTVQAAGNTYYVSTTGDDTTGTGSITNPWRTIQKAASTMVAGDTCIIRGGTYRETVTPTNSGTLGNSIKFQAYTGETVTVSGADLVTGWTQHSGSIYKATKTLSLGDQNQIFVDGQMVNNARWPNTGTNLVNPTFAIVDSGTATSITDADLSTLGFDPTGATVWCSGGFRWAAQTSTVTSYNASTGTINFNAFTTSNSWYDPKAGNPYYLFGKYEFLNTANEYFYNSGTTTLYLWAPDGGDPSHHTVEAKARTYAFDLSNRNYIEISGIKVFASTVTMSNATYCKLTNVEANYIYHFESLATGTAEHFWDSGIIVTGHDNEIRDSTITYSAGQAIMMSSLAGDTYNNKVINCLIHDIGYSGTNTAGIAVGGKDHAVSHCTIYNTGRSAIGPGNMKGGWIQYNHLYDTAYLTDDVGIIYEWQGEGQNTEIHHNVLHDSHAMTLPVAIYLDNGSTNWIVHHNVTWNCTNTAMAFNMPSNTNLIYNNTFYNKSFIGAGAPSDMYGVKVFNNIMTETPDPSIDISPYAVHSNNLGPGNNPVFVDAANKNFHLQSTSPCIDKGAIIPGITDGYSGSAPDIGAYEYNGTDWTAGHNFTTPPNPTFIQVNTPYMNRVKNAGFEVGSADPLRSWTKTDSATAAVISDLPGARSGGSYVRLGTGVDGIEQVVTGLSPNTEYNLAGWAKVASGESVRIGVKDYGGPDIYVTLTSTSWARGIVTFKTGVNNLSAKIYLYKPTASSNYVYGDDFAVTQNMETIKDISGIGNDATAFGNVTSVTGVGGGNAINLDGSSYTETPDSTSLQMSSAFTLEAWIYKPSTAPNAYMKVIDKGNFGNSNGYSLDITDTNKVRLLTAALGTNGSGLVSTNAITLDQWVHIAATYDNSTKTGKIYINGNLDATGTTTGSLVVTAAKLHIGADNLLGSKFVGNIDEARIYNVALTQTQIQADRDRNYNTTGLKLFYSFPPKTTGDIIVDEMNDYSKMYSHTANLTFDSANTSQFNMDNSRLCRTATSYENIVYNISSGNMTSMLVDTYFVTGETVVDFKFYTSSDGSTYTELTPAKNTMGGNWNRIQYTSSSLPSGTKYLKVEWRNTATSWTPQISRLEIGYLKGGYIVDEMNDYTKMYSHTPNFTFDSSNPAYFSGDTSRLCRTATSYENIIYNSSTNMTTMMVDTYFEPSLQNTDFKFYWSSDGASYTEFTPARTDLGGYWKRIKYESTSLPEGTKYLKIEFRTTDVSWNPNLSRLEIGYTN